jgi:hypothetical protein
MPNLEKFGVYGSHQFLSYIHVAQTTMMRIHTLSEPVSFRFPYGICTTRDLSIFRSRKHPSAADFRAPYERKARTGCRSRGVSRKSKSRKRHHSPYSRGPHDFEARAGSRSRDVLKESHPTFPWMRHGQKARVGSELGTKSMGNRSAVRAFCTEARATAITSSTCIRSPRGTAMKISLSCRNYPYIGPKHTRDTDRANQT